MITNTFTNTFTNADDSIPSCLICLEYLTDNIHKIEHLKCKYHLHFKCYEMLNRCLYCKEPLIDKKNFCYTYLDDYDRDLYDSIYFDYLNSYVNKTIFISPENSNINFLKFILIIIQSLIISFGIIMPNLIIIYMVKQLRLINIRLPINYQLFMIIQIIIATLYIRIIFLS